MADNKSNATMSNYEKAKNFIFGINRIDGFPVDALTGSIITADEQEIVILPSSVKMAWFRAVYPKGHCADEAFGECSENVANVKVTIYATGDTSEELSHAYAVRAFDPEKNAGWAPIERRTKLYNLAAGLAKSKALTEAGIGMGYYTSRQEFDEIQFDSITRSNVKPEPKPIPQLHEQEEIPVKAKPQRASAAATAETKLNEFVSVIDQICELYSGMQATLDDGTRKHFEGTLKALLERYGRLLSDLEARAEKGAANPDNGISRVLTAEIIAQEAARLPDNFKSKVTGEAEGEPLPSPTAPVTESKRDSEKDSLWVSGKDLRTQEINMADGAQPVSSANFVASAPGLEDYVIPCLNMKLKDLDKKRILWIALSTKPEFTENDKANARNYYRQVADPDEINAFERRLAG